MNSNMRTHLISSVLLPEQFRAEGSLRQQFFAGLQQVAQLDLEGTGIECGGFVFDMLS